MVKKQKKLKLKPSARDKRRYFLIKGVQNKQVEEAILDYVGVLGFAKSAYMVVKKKRQEIIGSCLVGSLNNVRASLALKGIKIERVSGTLKGLKG